ncbi:hypothetical protein BJL95_10145 [Methylomonas sp. LWB]|uniref:bacteriohemerythrin n=1 Tax=Methylomonas sp. LWB TaxID=1905845 RepID=UPI00090F06C4|nr:hemerythrin domain-containing protein [Methylomonas sp. LWB]OHX36142.1 hypothetical protein BJL95_10145 [Methylomonas sp. LWB]
MATFIWQDRYSIGDATVDDQHRHVFELAEQVLGASDRDELIHLFIRFFRHIREHFHCEEALMKRLDYPGYQAHVAAHDQMLDELIHLSSEVRGDRWNRSEITRFVNDWILVHIVEVDRLLGDFLADMAASTTPSQADLRLHSH